ncbi:hypothetical protein [Leclercia tamurae]|uniref:Uncharacterized protein n=1 Tax=Leclercia tamurae TaxID=2926467 RepID=A0ABT2REZ8_9ENTR|nr:hypothetical protein [Leclercia tamurae]MCU6679281.1 hypothetical protein [Leclercia tamurae]
MNMVPGGWKIDVKVNKNLSGMTLEQMSLFETAFRNFEGAKYTPLLYIGSQVVAGLQHAYVAECRLISPHPVEPTLVKVVVYLSSDNQLSISQISAI